MSKYSKSSQSSQSLQLVERQGDKLFTTSLLVAEKFNKLHWIVLRAIRNLECSEEFCRNNYSTYFLISLFIRSVIGSL